MKKLTQHLASIVLSCDQIPEKFWEPCQTSMAVFLNVKTVGALKLPTIFTWKLSVFVRVLYKPVLIWYMKRSNFWSGWEKRCLPIKQNCDPKYVGFLYITLLWSCYNINYYLMLPSISLIKKTNLLYICMPVE